MKRRDFLHTSLKGAAAFALAPAILKACSGSDPLHEIGIISGVVANETRLDPMGTLSSLAEMGYKYLEFGGTYGLEARELKKFLSGIGLKPLAGGTSMSGFEGEGLDYLIDEQLEMGKKYLVCYWPWTKAPEQTTMDDLKRIAEKLNTIGARCNAAGLRFAYHNHDHEFNVVAEGRAYDYLLRNTDPALVTMQLDLYWASVGGADPVEIVRRYPGRFELLHVKDAYDLNNRESFADVGQGVINFERILRERETGGFRHLIVEKDGAVNGLECAKRSIEHLESLDF